MSERSVYKTQVSELLFGSGLVREREFKEKADINFMKALEELEEENEAIEIEVNETKYLTKIINPVLKNNLNSDEKLSNLLEEKAKYFLIESREDKKVILIFDKDYNLIPIKTEENIINNFLEHSEKKEKICNQNLEELWILQYH